MILNCIAVDDEPLALDLILRFIGQTPFLNLVGSFETAIEALNGIEEYAPDLIFLDIQMPELNGMELAKILSRQHLPPNVIFTTAYNHFALEGYKVDAIDYLLKPFNYEEFLRAANKGRKLVSLIKESRGQAQSQENDSGFLFVKVEQQWVKVAFSDILYLESFRDYVKIYLLNSEDPLMALSTLKALEEKLPSSQFMRVQRSFIISLEKIAAVTKTAVQIGKTTIQVGEQYREEFKNFIGRWL